MRAWVIRDPDMHCLAKDMPDAEHNEWLIEQKEIHEKKRSERLPVRQPGKQHEKRQEQNVEVLEDDEDDDELEGPDSDQDEALSASE